MDQGERIADRYRLEARLGRGGFGTTWRAIEVASGRTVAVKLLHLERVDHWKAVELFAREARVLASLEHPRIPAYIDHFEISAQTGGYAIVQDFVPGETLRERLRRAEVLGADELADLLRALLEVCVYLHGLEPPVIHRDINPNNIMLREGARLDPVLIDFGTVQAALRSASTIASTAAGTFGFAPMEQFVGRSVPASDLYSIAMTWLTAATGIEPEALPFANNRVQIRAALAGIPTDARVLLLIEEMTEPDAARRPASAIEAIARLADPTAQGGTPWRPPDLPPGGRAAARVAHYRALADTASAVAAPLRWSELDLGRFDEAAVHVSGRFLVRAGRSLCTLDLDTFASRHLERGTASHGTPRSAHTAADGRAVLADVDGTWCVHLLDRRGQSARRVELELDGDTALRLVGGFGAGFALRPDGAVCAIVTRGGICTLFDTATGARTHRVTVDALDTTFIDNHSVRFAPDGSVLMIATHGATLCVAADGTQRLHPDVSAVAVSPDGLRLAIARDDVLEVGGLDSVFELTLRAPRRYAAEDVTDLRFSPDGTLLAVVGRARACVLDAASDSGVIAELDQPHRPGRPMESVDTVGFGADNDLVVVVGRTAATPSHPGKTVLGALYRLSRTGYFGSAALATLGFAEPDEDLMAVTVGGLHGRLDGHSPVSRLLAGARLAAIGGAPAEAAAEDLAARARFVAARVADETLLPGTATARLLGASAGMGHLLPAIFAHARTETAAADSARFGDRPTGGALGGQVVLASLARFSRMGQSERAVVFDASLAAIAAEAETDAAAAWVRPLGGSTALVHRAGGSLAVGLGALSVALCLLALFASPLLLVPGIGAAVGALVLRRR